MKRPSEIKVLIKGAGEIATGVGHRLYRAHFKLCMTETARPAAVRLGVSFCEAVYDGEKQVEGVTAKLISTPSEIAAIWQADKIPVLIDPEAKVRSILKPDVVIDAIIAKKNLGTKITDAPLVIGLGPGFTAGKDVHVVIETNRGHNLGRLIYEGEAEPNTGIPGEIGGVSEERVLHSPAAGIFKINVKIGNRVTAGDIVAFVDGSPLKAQVGGTVRGLLREGMEVHKGMKAGDIDPRATKEYCYQISDKSRTISGGVLEAILAQFNS